MLLVMFFFSPVDNGGFHPIWLFFFLSLFPPLPWLAQASAQSEEDTEPAALGILASSTAVAKPAAGSLLDKMAMRISQAQKEAGMDRLL